MNNKLALRILTVMLVLVVGFGVVGSASAIIKNTAVFNILSDDSNKWEHSNVGLELDGEPTYVIAELGNDNLDFFYIASDQTGYLTDNDSGILSMCQTVDAAKVEAMNPFSSTVVTCDDELVDAKGDPNPIPTTEYGKFAGLVELGIPRRSDGPAYTNDTAALVFDYSNSWSIIDCDINGDGVVNNADDAYDLKNPINTLPPALAPWTTDANAATHFKIMSIDYEIPSGNGQATELVTTIFFDLDVNDSGVIEICPANTDPSAANNCEAPAHGKLCFFAAVYPVTYKAGDPIWAQQQPPQARFSTSGGDKTVSLSLFGPTAITLEQLVAQSPGGIHPFVWAAIFVLLTGISFVLIRESRRQVFIRKDE